MRESYRDQSFEGLAPDEVRRIEEFPFDNDLTDEIASITRDMEESGVVDLEWEARTFVTDDDGELWRADPEESDWVMLIVHGRYSTETRMILGIPPLNRAERRAAQRRNRGSSSGSLN